MTTLPLGEGVGLGQQANLQILDIGRRRSKLPVQLTMEFAIQANFHRRPVIPSEASLERSESHAESTDLVLAA
jgi:hypothetical protein